MTTVIGPQTAAGSAIVVLGQLTTPLSRWFLPASVRPISDDNEVKTYIDVPAVWADMRRAIQRATTSGRHFIYLTAWSLGLDTEMGSKGSPGLRTLLKEASDNRGIQVRALLWKRQGSASWNKKEVDFINSLKNAQAIHDDRVLTFGAHHQKLLIVNNSDGLTAFSGSMDIHPFRRGWHEVHSRVRGPAAKHLHDTFTERWNDFPQVLLSIKKRPLLLLSSNAIKPKGTATLQVVRTYGNGSRHPGISGVQPVTISGIPVTLPGKYKFAPNGEQTVYGQIKNAIEQAKIYIYLEDQYLLCSKDMNRLAAMSRVLADKLKAATEGRSSLEKLIILIARTEQINGEQRQAWQRRRDFIGTLVAADDPNNQRLVVCQYKRPNPLFVHAKTWIFDDQFAIIGSANCNRRGYSHDSEVNVGVVDKIPPDFTGEQESLVQRLRIDLWQKHLSPVAASGGQDPSLPGVKLDSRTLFDPRKVFRLWEKLDPKARIELYDSNPPSQKPADGDVVAGHWLADFLASNLSLENQWDIGIDPDGS